MTFDARGRLGVCEGIENPTRNLKLDFACREIQLPNTQRRLESEDSDHLTELVFYFYFFFFSEFYYDSHA